MSASQNTERVTIQVSHRYALPPERVFDAWLDAETVGQWLFATPDGEVVRAEIEPRVGGRYEIVDRREGEDVLHTGEYLELERPKRIVFTLSVPKYSPLVDRIALDFAPDPEGCTATLTHEVPAEWAESSREGWRGIMEKLAQTLK